MVLPPNLAALLCLALTSSPPKVHTTTPSARRPFPTKTPRAATLQLSALGRSEDANTRRARVMASAANNVTTAPPELAPFIETLANQLPSAWASLPEALRKFLPDYEPDEALAGKDMAAKAAAEEAEAAAQKVLAMRAKRMGAESVMAVETSKKEQHNNILTTYGADYGAEAPAPTREYSSSYGVDAGAGAGASAGGSTRQGGPPIDEERRNRSPGLQRNFYDVPTSDFKRPHGMMGGVVGGGGGGGVGGSSMPPASQAPPSDQGSATPYGVDYGLPPGTQFGAETPLEGQARERAMAAFKARAGSESPADVSARVLSIRTMYSALNVPVDASMTRWTDAELGEYFASGGLNRPGMPKPQPGQAPEAAPYVPPPIDQDRRSRSPGLSRNFYEIPTADFKRPHGVRGPLPPDPPPPAAAPPSMAFGAESPAPGREREYQAYQAAQGGAGQSMGGGSSFTPPASSFTPPPIDQERRNRSPGLSRNFYEISTSDFKRPHGMRGPMPPEAPPPSAAAPPMTFGAQAPASGYGSYQTGGPPAAPPPPMAFGAESPAPGREREYQAYQAAQGGAGQSMGGGSSFTPPASSFTPPPIDQERRNRSPGLSRNFYEISTSDFKRPHGMRGPMPPEAPPPSAAAPPMTFGAPAPAPAFPGMGGPIPGQNYQVERATSYQPGGPGQSMGAFPSGAFPSFTPPPVDEDRRNRSPGMQRNFYDVPTSDFKRPHGMMGQTPQPPAALEAPPAAANYGAQPTNAPSQYGATSPTAPAAQNGASMRFPTSAATRRPVPPAAATTLPEPAWAAAAPSQQPAAPLNGPAVPTWEASTPPVQAAPATAPGVQSAAAATAAAAAQAATAAAATEAATAAAATEAATAAAAAKAADAAAATEAATAAAVAKAADAAAAAAAEAATAVAVAAAAAEAAALQERVARLEDFIIQLERSNEALGTALTDLRTKEEEAKREAVEARAREEALAQRLAALDYYIALDAAVAPESAAGGVVTMAESSGRVGAGTAAVTGAASVATPAVTAADGDLFVWDASHATAHDHATADETAAAPATPAAMPPPLAAPTAAPQAAHPQAAHAAFPDRPYAGWQPGATSRWRAVTPVTAAPGPLPSASDNSARAAAAKAAWLASRSTGLPKFGKPRMSASDDMPPEAPYLPPPPAEDMVEASMRAMLDQRGAQAWAQGARAQYHR